MKTDLERKKYLAGLMPNHLEYTEYGFTFKSDAFPDYVTDREWDWVVKEVVRTKIVGDKDDEDSLPSKFCDALTFILFGDDPDCIWHIDLITATWQQKTDALMEVCK